MASKSESMKMMTVSGSISSKFEDLSFQGSRIILVEELDMEVLCCRENGLKVKISL